MKTNFLSTTREGKRESQVALKILVRKFELSFTFHELFNFGPTLSRKTADQLPPLRAVDFERPQYDPPVPDTTISSCMQSNITKLKYGKHLPSSEKNCLSCFCGNYFKSSLVSRATTISILLRSNRY